MDGTEPFNSLIPLGWCFTTLKVSFSSFLLPIANSNSSRLMNHISKHTKWHLKFSSILSPLYLPYVNYSHNIEFKTALKVLFSQNNSHLHMLSIQCRLYCGQSQSVKLRHSCRRIQTAMTNINMQINWLIVPFVSCRIRSI